MPSVRRRSDVASIRLLFVTVLLLTAAPRMGIKVGPMPIYLIDIFLVLTLISSLQIRSRLTHRKPLKGIVMALMGFVVVSEFYGIAASGRPLNPIYEMIRMLLAMSLFFSVGRIVRSEKDVLAVIKAMMLGAVVTASLMIMTSVPFTRGIATSYVFSWSFLEPAAETTLRIYSDTDDPMRGRSLVGVSILSGAFLNIGWPMAALLYQWRGRVQQVWKKGALISMLLTPIGIVMSYSRGAVLGLFFVVMGALLLGAEQARRGILIGAIGAVALFGFVGWDSELFFFERLENRTQAMLENPYQDERETARLFAYVDPFFHLQQHPEFLIFGRGQTYGRYGIADHAVFAKAYVAYGMMAAFLYMFLVVRAFSFLWGRAVQQVGRDPFARRFAQTLLVSMLGMLPWLTFGHAAVSSPRGAMMLFLVLGLVASLRNFELGKTVVPKSRFDVNAP